MTQYRQPLRFRLRHRHVTPIKTVIVDGRPLTAVRYGFASNENADEEHQGEMHVHFADDGVECEWRGGSIALRAESGGETAN
jgi:hypothetical protein